VQAKLDRDSLNSLGKRTQREVETQVNQPSLFTIYASITSYSSNSSDSEGKAAYKRLRRKMQFEKQQLTSQITKLDEQV